MVVLTAVDPLLTRLHHLNEVLVQDISVAVTEAFSFISYLKGEGGRRREGEGWNEKGKRSGERSRGEVGRERSVEGRVENRRVEGVGRGKGKEQ